MLSPETVAREDIMIWTAGWLETMNRHLRQLEMVVVGRMRAWVRVWVRVIVSRSERVVAVSSRVLRFQDVVFAARNVILHLGPLWVQVSQLYCL